MDRIRFPATCSEFGLATKGKTRDLVRPPTEGRIRDPDLLERRRREILDVAQDLFLEKGFKATTVRQICQLAGVNQASIYDYFPSKRDILQQLLIRMFEGRMLYYGGRSLNDPTYESLEDALYDVFHYAWTKNRKPILLIYKVASELDRDTLRMVLGRDSALVGEVTSAVERFAGISGDDPRLPVLANMIIYLNAFLPLRDWYDRDVSPEFVARTLANAVSAMVQHLAED